MSTCVIIQARMQSTRLPGKVLRPINGKPLLWYLVERIKRCQTVDKIIIATVDTPSCDPIAAWCYEERVLCYRGSEEDVLARYYKAALEHGASTVVRVTSDCPIIDPAVIDLTVRRFQSANTLDFVANTVPLPCLYPDGMDVEVFDLALLKRAYQEAVLPSEREHVTFYFWKSGKFRCARVDPEADYSQYRFTVDYLEDFTVMRAILTELYALRPDFSMHDAIEFVNRRPELLKLQEGIIRNGGWHSALKKDEAILRKGVDHVEDQASNRKPASSGRRA